jgi:hypothetical protein
MNSSTFGDVCYICGWASLFISVVAWFGISHDAGLYIGLWVPTFFAISIRDLIINK